MRLVAYVTGHGHTSEVDGRNRVRSGLVVPEIVLSVKGVDGALPTLRGRPITTVLEPSGATLGIAQFTSPRGEAGRNPALVRNRRWRVEIRSATSRDTAVVCF